MNNINEIMTWQKSFGLLPIHLFTSQENNNSYILHNGGNGDFCLNTNHNDLSPENYCSYAWSSNTKIFVAIEEENVRIYNWKKGIQEESIKKNQIVNNFDKFYKYVVSNSYKSDKDVVPFVIDIFKQLRSITQEKTNANEALNLLFILLAGIEDDTANLDFQKWGLQQLDIPTDFQKYIDKFKNGYSNILPNLELIIRHSAGILFQEAQKEVQFLGQINLWGGYSGNNISRKFPYSSVHYTPSYLARTIVENAIKQLDLSKQEIKIFDPACGSSEFLIEALKQLRESEFTGNVNIVGWDSSETAINISNFLLTYEKRKVWKNKLNFKINLVKDSLIEKWDDDYDLILMNPPFISWEHLDDISRDAVNKTLPRKDLNRPNLASAFFYKATFSLNDNGIIGSVMPSSFLTLDSYHNLRKELLDHISIDLIGKLGNFIFEYALTDVSFIIGHKPKNNSLIPFVLWTNNEKGVAQDALRNLRKAIETDSNKTDEYDYSIYRPSVFPININNWKIISYKENEIYKLIERLVLEKKLVRIQDIFEVKQGVRTGKNVVFKISHSVYNDLPKEEKIYFKPVVDKDAIEKFILKKVNFLWYPYDNNTLMIKTEKELQKKAPSFYKKFLLPNKNDLIKRARKNQKNWWLLSEHRAWLSKTETRLISKEFGKSDSFALDKKGEFIIERGNAWLPKKTYNNKDHHYFYLAIFSSSHFDKLLSIYSRQLLSGWDLGCKYTKDIPIPDVKFLESNNLEIYNKIVDVGKKLTEGQFYLTVIIDDILNKYLYPDIYD